MTDTLPDAADEEPPEIIGEAFAILPERVLYAQVSAHAVRIYAALQRYVNLPLGAIPSRATIADRVHVSRSTANRAIKELVDAGMITVEPRFREGTQERTSSRFILHGSQGGGNSVDNRGVGSRVTQPRVTGDTTGRLTGETGKRVSSRESDPDRRACARERTMEANRRRRQGLPPLCEKCEDVGVWTDEAGAHHCPCTL